MAHFYMLYTATLAILSSVCAGLFVGGEGNSERYLITL